MKNLRRIACLVLVLTMVLCMAMPSYAANSEETPNNNLHTITISNATESDLGKYQAYQIFRGDISDGKLTNITWGTGVSAGVELTYDLSNHDVIGASISAAIAAAAEKNQTEAEAVASVVAGMANDSAALDAFAEVIGNHLSNTCFTNGTNAATINVTGDGYYLLKYVGTPGQGDAYTKYILKVAEDVQVTAKKDAPTSEKFILKDGETVKATDASIGDKVEFKLVSSIPSMDGYDKYYYIIHDTLSDGLTFNNDVEVKLNGKKLMAYDENSEYEECGYVVNVNGQSIEIVFLNFLQYKGQTGEIVTTYSATINENAVINEDGNTNNAWLQYSNDPNFDHDGDSNPGDSTDPTDPTNPTDPTEPDPSGDKPGPDEPTGITPGSTVTIYTTALKINKVDEDGKALTGAKFSISGVSTNIYKINGTVYQKNANGTWYRLKDGTYTETAPTDATADLYDGTDKYAPVTVNEETSEMTNVVSEGWVDANGVLTFDGLGAGTYTITELQAPAGYNLLESPITVTVTWNGTDAENMWTVTASSVGVDGENDAIGAVLADNTYAINVVNQAGVTLPSTGGVGTTIFYIVGGLLVLAAVVLLVTKRRMGNVA